jgi:hypothetical protein
VAPDDLVFLKTAWRHCQYKQFQLLTTRMPRA